MNVTQLHLNGGMMEHIKIIAKDYGSYDAYVSVMVVVIGARRNITKMKLLDRRKRRQGEPNDFCYLFDRQRVPFE